MQPVRRLHISPLNPDLLPIILPGSLLEKATNISFHNIETFPEKNYGYVELPEPEADKLKKKMNGSTLKGLKMKVEEARPKKTMKKNEGQAEEAAEKVPPEKKKRKAETKEQGVLPGHVLQDRKVRRGWTEPPGDSKPSKGRRDKSEKKSKPSSVTGEAECLFKAKLPPNASSTDRLKDGKAKKRGRGELTHDVVVHEFENNTKHASFLRGESDAKGKRSAVEYIEGKGWVDEDGNVVEGPSKRRRSKSESNVVAPVLKVEKPASRRSSRLEAIPIPVTASKELEALDSAVDDETSSSGTSSDESASEANQCLRSPSPPANVQTIRGSGRKTRQDTSRNHEVEADRVQSLSITRSSATPPPSQEVPPTSVPSTDEVHPLEALFKRPNTAASRTPRRPDLEVSTSFSFVDQDGEDSGNPTLAVPQTPFTQQDIRQRRQRSAAPTPDTAAPGKTFGDIWEGTSDVSADEEEAGPSAVSRSKDKSATPDINEEKPESDFSKWFWEHRGENNRAWKRRRREAAKEKRQKENKELRE